VVTATSPAATRRGCARPHRRYATWRLSPALRLEPDHPRVAPTVLHLASVSWPL